MKNRKKAFIFFITFTLCLTACQQAKSPNDHEDGIIPGETEMTHHTEADTTELPYESKQETACPPVNSVETDADPSITDETLIGDETETKTQLSSNDAFWSATPDPYDSIEEFLEQWWKKEKPNNNGIKEGFVIVPNLKLDGYKLRSVLATSSMFCFEYVPVTVQRKDRVDESDVLSIKYMRWDVDRETGPFDQSYPYKHYNTWTFMMRMQKREITATFPEAVFPKTVEELEQILSFEVRYAPESTTAEAETNPVQ